MARVGWWAKVGRPGRAPGTRQLAMSKQARQSPQPRADFGRSAPESNCLNRKLFEILAQSVGSNSSTLPRPGCLLAAAALHLVEGGDMIWPGMRD